MGQSFPILLLDVMMEGMDGMELAAALRAGQEEAAIIFVSSNREMALRGYEVAAARYLAKPLDAAKLREALLHCCAAYMQPREIVLPTADGQSRIPVSAIVYVEPWDRGVRLHLAPLETEEWSGRETAAIEGLPVLSQGYRAQIVTVMDGEEIDVTKEILDLRALLLAEAVSPVAEDAEVNLLLVPLEEQEEIVLSPASRIEATETEPARYEAPLTGSGLLALVGE